MLRTVRLLMSGGEFQRVWGWAVDDYLAVTPAYFADIFGRWVRLPGVWRVTHIPSGFAVGQPQVGQEIWRSVEMAQALCWRGVNPLQMPVCELEALFRVVVGEIGRRDVSDDEVCKVEEMLHFVCGLRGGV